MKYIALIIIVGLIIFVFVGCPIIIQANNEADKQEEIQEFKEQMQEDPKYWTKEEIDRYNNFMEWEDTHD